SRSSRTWIIIERQLVDRTKRSRSRIEPFSRLRSARSSRRDRFGRLASGAAGGGGEASRAWRTRSREGAKARLRYTASAARGETPIRRAARALAIARSSLERLSENARWIVPGWLGDPLDDRGGRLIDRPLSPVVAAASHLQRSGRRGFLLVDASEPGLVEKRAGPASCSRRGRCALPALSAGRCRRRSGRLPCDAPAGSASRSSLRCGEDHAPAAVRARDTRTRNVRIDAKRTPALAARDRHR